MDALRRQVTYDLETWRTVRLRRDIADEVAALADRVGLPMNETLRRLVAYALPRVKLRERLVRVYDLGFIDIDPAEEADTDA